MKLNLGLDRAHIASQHDNGAGSLVPLATRAASGIPEFDALLDRAKAKAPERSLYINRGYHIVY